MRADRAMMLAAVLAAALVGRPARADDVPDPGEPECVQAFCACDNAWHACDFDCAALCPSSGDGDSSSSSTTRGTPPILKAAVGLVVAAAFVGIFVLAPAHTLGLGLIGHPQSAADANQAWRERATALAGLEAEGRRLKAEGADLATAVRSATPRPLAARVSSAYTPPPPSPAADRWSSGGYCSRLLERNTEALRTASEEATAHGYDSFLPRPPGPGAAARTTRDVGAALAGPRELAEHRVALVHQYDAAKEYYDFMQALLACTHHPDVEANACLNLLTTTEVPAALKGWVDEVIGPATTAAIERVREFSGFYVSYVDRLTHEVMAEAMAATRCP